MPCVSRSCTAKFAPAGYEQVLWTPSVATSQSTASGAVVDGTIGVGDGLVDAEPGALGAAQLSMPSARNATPRGDLLHTAGVAGAGSKAPDPGARGPAESHVRPASYCRMSVESIALVVASPFASPRKPQCTVSTMLLVSCKTSVASMELTEPSQLTSGGSTPGSSVA